MAVEEFESPAYLEMSRAGMVKSFDQEEELVGVSLRVEMGHPGEELLLAQIGRSLQEREQELLRVEMSYPDVEMSSLVANIRMMFSYNTDRLCDSPDLLALATAMLGRTRSCLTSSETKDEAVDEIEGSFDEDADEPEPSTEESSDGSDDDVDEP
jgi:hypothetical protein